MARGADDQKLPKVKGHAAKKDVDEGIAKQVDKEGSGMADECTDKVVLQLGGKALNDAADELSNLVVQYTLLN